MDRYEMQMRTWRSTDEGRVAASFNSASSLRSIYCNTALDYSNRSNTLFELKMLAKSAEAKSRQKT